MLNFVKSFFTPAKQKTTTDADLSYDYDKQAIVDEHIYPNRKGRVYYGGTCWPARCQEKITIEPGEMVEVVHIHKITLWVKPFSRE